MDFWGPYKLLINPYNSYLPLYSPPVIKFVGEEHMKKQDTEEDKKNMCSFVFPVQNS